ncbi:hypothetical protein ABW365_16285 [Enterococcus avium]
MAGKIISSTVVMCRLSPYVYRQRLSACKPKRLLAVCLFLYSDGRRGNLYNIPFMAYLQETVAPEKLGRVFSLFGA